MKEETSVLDESMDRYLGRSRALRTEDKQKQGGRIGGAGRNRTRDVLFDSVSYISFNGLDEHVWHDVPTCKHKFSTILHFGRSKSKRWRIAGSGGYAGDSERSS